MYLYRHHYNTGTKVNQDMSSKPGNLKIGPKMYLFVIGTVLFAVAGICAISFLISADQIDSYYRRLAYNSAKNYATLADVKFLSELRPIIESEEYQELRDLAEETDNDELIEDFLREHGLWDKYVTERNKLRTYVASMGDVKYLYLIVWGDQEAMLDMYLIDADDVPLYETGYYEEREAEFEGVSPENYIEPVISNGDWGWLCSAYAPVYDLDGNLICHVGCDVGMEDVMTERYTNLMYVVLSAFAFTVLVLIIAIQFVNRVIVNPLRSITLGMKRFVPVGNKDYEQAGVLNLDLKTKDEINDVYEGIRSMQIRIIDYIDDITHIKREKEQVELEIGKVSQEAYRDPLTGIGNKSAYVLKVKELNNMIYDGNRDFSIVMVDVNCLKDVNDEYGHTCGDLYLKGSCHIICEVFKHSPIYRIGGDEFVAVLTGEDYDNRKEKMKLLNELFDEAYEDQSSDPWLRYSASVGIADCGEKDLSAEFVFARADKEMYDAKTKFKKDHNMEQGPLDNSEA